MHVYFRFAILTDLSIFISSQSLSHLLLLLLLLLIMDSPTSSKGELLSRLCSENKVQKFTFTFFIGDEGRFQKRVKKTFPLPMRYTLCLIYILVLRKKIRKGDFESF